MRGLGFDGTNTILGHKSGVQARMRLYSHSALYIHCHYLQLLSIDAADEHLDVKRVLGKSLTIWKWYTVPSKKLKSLLNLYIA